MSEERTGPDVVLVRRASRGDARAWQRIVDECGPGIHGLARRFARDESDAEDLTQDIFLKIYQNLSRFRGDVPFVGWALRLSRNVCIDRYRANRARPFHDPTGDDAVAVLEASDDPERRTLIGERRRLVREVLAEMSETLSLVWVLRDVEGLSEDDAATFLDVPAGTVKSRLHRARADLVRRIGERLGVDTGPDRLREMGSC